MEQATQLKKPTGVIVLAILFILAPLGNLFISFATSGVDGWYQPAILGHFLATVPMLDWLWLAMLLVTGILLLRPHKTSWSIAIITLLLVLGMNVYRAASSEFYGEPVLQWHIAVSVLVTFAGLMTAFYFRFPYLDRRAQWIFPTAHRVTVRTPVQIVAQDIFDGVTESLSVSGARIRLQRDMGVKAGDLRFVDLIFSELKNLKTKAMVVEYRENLLRVKFKELSTKDRTTIMGWLQSQVESKRT
ncbi:PilZ domain protein [compost metagenome]